MNLLNKNVTIVVIILVLVVIAGYLVWIRSRVQMSVSPRVEEQQEVVITTVPQASDEAEVSSPSAKEATGSVKEKGATSSSTKK